MLIDTHCHLTFDDLAPRVDDVLERARQADVNRVITVATTVTDARAALAIAEQHENVFVAAGIHPHEAAKTSQDDMNALADLHRGAWDSPVCDRVVAVGETGLDFHYDFATPEQQERLFRFQLDLARETNHPVIIHAREAEERVCDILTEYPALSERAVFHCYSGGPDLTRRIIDAGYWLSFTGVVTFKNAGEIRESARLTPSDRIMVETDAPFMSPEPIRKVRPCEPAFVTHTLQGLAQTRETTYETLASETTANAIRFFNLPEDES